jgi:hypothetical protein
VSSRLALRRCGILVLYISIVFGRIYTGMHSLHRLWCRRGTLVLLSGQPTIIHIYPCLLSFGAKAAYMITSNTIERWLENGCSRSVLLFDKRRSQLAFYAGVNESTPPSITMPPPTLGLETLPRGSGDLNRLDV